MELDIRTLIIVIITTYLIQALVFYYQYKTNKNIMGPGWWLLWSLSGSVMLGLMFLRHIPSLQQSVIALQNAVAVLGMIFLYIGTLKFFGRNIHLKFLVSAFIIFLTIHFYFNVVNDDIKVRTILISLTFALFSFLTAFSILKFKDKGLVLSSNFNAIIFILYGSFFVNRTIMIYLGIQSNELLSPSLLNSMAYFIGLVISSVLTLGFIMMINQRLTSEINEAKAHFELIYNTSPDAIIISRLNDSLLLECNESFVNNFGFSNKEVMGNLPARINYWKNTDDRVEVIRLIKERGSCDNYETFFQRKNGQIFPGLLSAKILYIKEVQYLYSVIRDITERKEIEEEIKQKNKELHNLNVSKDKFFSIIAHDLKSPFNLFLGFTELMVEQSKDWTISTYREYATLMRESATNLYRLLENLLEWSRMEQGLIPFNVSATFLNLMINESLISIMEVAKLKEIEIISGIANDYEVLVDKNILQTVIRNLLSNAVKFTPKGGKITISTSSSENKMIQVSIRDSGIGMSSEMIDNLFKLGIQINRKGTENEPSTGLGLILCKEFVERHNGRIWAESEMGKGSVFHFTIPCC